MKKYKLFTALSVIGAGIALASCGNTTESSNSGVTSTPKPTDTLPQLQQQVVLHHLLKQKMTSHMWLTLNIQTEIL